MKIPSWVSWGFGLFVLSLFLCWYVTCLTLSFNTVYFNSHYFFVILYSWTVIILAAFRPILNQSRCSLKPINFLWGLCPPDPPPTPPLALLVLAMLAFLLIMFIYGIISVYYLILYPAGFSDTHLGRIKMAWD